MNRFYGRYVKRGADVIVSLVLLGLLFPVLVVAILVLAVTNNGGVFFLQERPGLNGKLFRIIKLKTMNDNGQLTKTGRFLRTSSIDELPQLLNVLKGDMSLIGPRPLLKEYLPLYSPQQARRHEVRPGITGWAQINGRNAISWERKFELDVWYVDHLSLSTDLKIFMMTIHHVLFRTDTAEGEDYVIPFNDGDAIS